MEQAEVMEIVRESLNELLRWVGFGTLVGLAAKAIMPGRDPGGAVTTVLMGVGGSVIGCGTVMFFFQGTRVDPISGKGFLAATAGAFMLLFFYRLMAGAFFVEGNEADDAFVHTTRRRTRRRRIADNIRDAA